LIFVFILETGFARGTARRSQAINIFYPAFGAVNRLLAALGLDLRRMAHQTGPNPGR
jgi:hypothetical protein